MKDPMNTLQTFKIGEIFPPTRGEVTFKKARRAKAQKPEAIPLPLPEDEEK